MVAFAPFPQDGSVILKKYILDHFSDTVCIIKIHVRLITYLIKEGQHCQTIRFILSFIKAFVLLRVVVDHMKL